MVVAWKKWWKKGGEKQYFSAYNTFLAHVCLWLFSINREAPILFLDLSTTLLSSPATYNMFTHPDEFNYIFSEEITVGVAQAARGQCWLWILKLLPQTHYTAYYLQLSTPHSATLHIKPFHCHRWNAFEMGSGVEKTGREPELSPGLIVSESHPHGSGKTRHYRLGRYTRGQAERKKVQKEGKRLMPLTFFLSFFLLYLCGGMLRLMRQKGRGQESREVSLRWSDLTER